MSGKKPISSFEEKEAAPGIFITDFRSQNPVSPSSVEILASESNSVAALMLDVSEIETAIAHLLRSQAELREALETDPGTANVMLRSSPPKFIFLTVLVDPVYQEAIEENTRVIERKRRLLESLKDKLAMLGECL